MKMYFTDFVHDIFTLKCDKSKTCNYTKQRNKKISQIHNSHCSADEKDFLLDANDFNVIMKKHLYAQCQL